MIRRFGAAREGPCMGLVDMVLSAEGRSLLHAHAAREFLRGCVRVEDAPQGWARPWRITPYQLRVLGSCMAWHPGLYKRMARTSAGCCLRFVTDANEVVLLLRVDAPRPAEGVAPSALGLVVDGEPRGRVDLRELPDGVPGVEGSEGAFLASLRLAEPGEAPGPGMVPLPGFGRMREVAVYLPYLSGCEVRELWHDGVALDAAPERPQLTVIGDSIAQGCYVDDPSAAWPVLLAERLGMDLLNQSIAGQVFQPDFARGLAQFQRPALAVVALGTNYRFEACQALRVMPDIRAFFFEMDRAWDDVTTFVLTPTAHDESRYQTHRRSCYDQVSRMIKRAAEGPNQRVVDGATLLGTSDLGLLADSDHPGKEGHAQIASRLRVLVQADGADPSAAGGAARRTLDQAGDCAFGMGEALRRGVAHAVYGDDHVALLRYGSNGRMVCGDDAGEVASVLGALCTGSGVSEVLACGAGLGDVVRRSLSLDVVDPVVQAFWRKKSKVKVAAALASKIRPVGVEAERDVARLVGPACRASMAWIRLQLELGTVLGAFEDNKLVGVAGELEDGSIGMLGVQPGQRRRGWAQALVAAKANEFVARGEHPWLAVYPYEKTLTKRLRELGFSISPATEQCLVRRSAAKLATGASDLGAGEPYAEGRDAEALLSE